MDRSRLLKIGLVLAAVALLGWLLLAVDESRQLRFSTTTPPNELSSAPTVKQVAQGTTATTVLGKPRYSGQDEDGNQWMVEADEAVQSGSVASSTLVLQQVSAQWQQPGQTLTLRADNGVYHLAQKVLVVEGNVHATGADLVLDTPKATADMTSRLITGNNGVVVTGDLGGYDSRLTAQSFELNGDARQAVFTGGVRVVLRR